jgi:hypothetical protein
MKPATRWMYAAFLGVLISALCFGFAAESTFAALPDGRVYELVSTPSGAEHFEEVHVPWVAESQTGADIRSHQPFQAGVDGDAVAYVGEAGPAGGNAFSGFQWLATRTATGWTTRSITPGASASDSESAYVGFSSDLSTSIFELSANLPLTSEAPAECRVLYSRANTIGTFKALLTGASTTECGRPTFAGMSAGANHVIFQSEAALTANAHQAVAFPPGRTQHNPFEGEWFGEPCEFGCNLYDSAGGTLQLVNVLPDGSVVDNANFGGYSASTINKPEFSNAISADGSRIFWTDTQEGEDLEHVYVREDGTRTVQVSGAASAEYWTATPDGRYAFYTEEGDLWRFDTHSEERSELAGPSAGVLGVIGASEDGGHVYFVAHGVLASNENAQHETAQKEEPNLYLWRDGAITYIATLSREDGELLGNESSPEAFGDWVPNLGSRTAQVTPDGHHLVFESLRPLTGYDNAVQNLPDVEVFVFDASTGRIRCASCDPRGNPPEIAVDASKATLLPVTWPSDTYMRRWMSNDGLRVFFESRQRLVPADTNSVRDVYEWEQEGTAGCPAATSRYGGCVYLLSGGESNDNSFLVDADAAGDNVFFTHRGPLGHTEPVGDRVALYDARVNGGFAQTTLACTGTGCQGVPPASPTFAAPPSVTFTGAGNFPSSNTSPSTEHALDTRTVRLAAALKACHRKRNHRKRLACERQARRQHGNARKATRPATRRERRSK